jgi:hypothetical protein
MIILETAAPLAESTSRRARFSDVLLFVGVALALIVNAAWLAVLGSFILKLVRYRPLNRKGWRRCHMEFFSGKAYCGKSNVRFKSH